MGLGAIHFLVDMLHDMMKKTFSYILSNIGRFRDFVKFYISSIKFGPKNQNLLYSIALCLSVCLSVCSSGCSTFSQKPKSRWLRYLAWTMVMMTRC